MRKLKTGTRNGGSRLRSMMSALWSHDWVRRATLWVMIFLGIVIGVQFAYPKDRALPYAHIGDTSVGWKLHSELLPMLEDNFTETEVTLQAATQSSTLNLGDAGVSLQSDRAAAQLSAYPWWQRIVPFSLFVVRPSVARLPLEFNDTKLAATAETQSTKLHSEPKNGIVSVTDSGEVTVSAAEDGVTVSAATIQAALKSAKLHFGVNTVVLTPQLSSPSVTNEMVESVKTELAALLKTKLVITNSLDASAQYTPDAKTIATWIRIGDKLALSIDADAVQSYANDVAQNNLIAAGTTTVATTDGIEQSRTTGTSGRAVDNAALVESVSRALLSGGETAITMKFKTVAPTIVYQRSYSSSQKALQAYVEEIAAGKNIAIAVTQLTGAGWSASTNATKSVVAASTYKLFVSSVLFDKINSAQLHWSDAIQGTNVENCLRTTIVVSANNCAEQWISDWGRSTLNKALYAKGISSATTFTASDAAHTSAADLQKMLVGLHDKTLFNESDSSRLIELMKQQVYRKGIPAGSNGVVADKVGFLWDYLNDAAIVYHPRGTYVLVVMTQGQSWAKIAEITTQIEKIMYP